MPSKTVLIAILLFSAGAMAAAVAAPPPIEHPALHTISREISASRLQATLQQLVDFGTRQTMSETQSDHRGIGAARRWVKVQFQDISKACGNCLEIVTPSKIISGERIPKPTKVMDIVAILRGRSDPQRVIVMTAHLDSRVSNVMNATANAPGADDDGSGVAAVIEAARVLTHQRYPATLVFGVDSGEEQGLYGGKILAAYAVAKHWQVEANLNNDIIGAIAGENGVIDNTRVRVFSQGTKSNETLRQARYRNYTGGEVDSPSRNLARFIATLAPRYVTNLQVQMIYRTDRYGRGGDQVAFLNAGYPAIRFTEPNENYRHQHQNLRTVNGIRYGDTINHVNFPYLAKVTALNAVTMAALARAPVPPAELRISGAVTPNTTLSWQPVAGAASYLLRWRDTTAPQWQYSRWVPLSALRHEAHGRLAYSLQNIVIDNDFFGVSSVSADGYVSPAEFPGFAGSFRRSPPATSVKH